VASSIVALREEDVVVLAALEGLVERGGLANELLFNLAKTVKTRLKLEVVVGVGLGNCRNDGDVVALGANVVGGGNDSNVDVCKSCQYEACGFSWVNLPFLRPTCD
jgi:hypothetical protein